MIIWDSFVNQINELKSHEFQNQDTSTLLAPFQSLFSHPLVVKSNT